MTSEWALVGPYVLARRKELGLTQEEVKTRGGPSAALVRQLENGNYDASMNPAVEGGLERALEWKVGSIESIMNGGAPYPEEKRPTSMEAAQRLEYVQSLNRRANLPGAVFMRWYAARIDVLGLEQEYADALGIDVDTARKRLDEIAIKIEADWAPGGSFPYSTMVNEMQEGGTGDGEPPAQKSDYGLAAKEGHKEPYDE